MYKIFLFLTIIFINNHYLIAEELKNGFDLNVGAAIPIGDAFEEHTGVESGTGLNIGVDFFHFFTNNVGLDLNLSINRNDFRGSVYETRGNFQDVGTMSSIFLLPGFKFRYPGVISPFVKFAFGVAFNSFDQNVPIRIFFLDPTIGRIRTDNVFLKAVKSPSFLIGGGVDIRTKDWFSFGLMAQFQWNNTEIRTEESSGILIDESDSSLSVYVTQASLGFHF